MTTKLDRSRAAAVGTDRPGLAGLLREVRSAWRDSRKLWMAALPLAFATSILAYLTYLHELRPQGLAWGLGIRPLHGIVSVLAMAAGYRAVLAGGRSLWRPDGDTLRFFGGALIELGLAIAAVVIARLWVGAMVNALGLDAATGGTLKIVAVGLIAIAVTIGFLRVQPWLAALAIGDRGLGIQRSWAETAGMNWPLIASWLLLLLPLLALYSAVDIAALRIGGVGPAHAGLAVLAGLLETAMMLATVLLNSAVYRLIRGSKD